jgi:uncharacterized linocin/CFP29 family protein
MNALAQAQATKLRVVRQALQPVIGHGYVVSVQGHRLAPAAAGQPMNIHPFPPLRPLQLSRSFFLHREQSGDADILKALITQAAADLAQAEDAVIFHGLVAQPTLINLNITFDPADLAQQAHFLLPGGANIPPGPGQLLNSILVGRQTLQNNAYYGEYYVIVSPELYREAYQNIAAGLNAPIYQIQALLATNGFLSSNALAQRRGVIFSLARGTISLSVPVDLYVDTAVPNDFQGRQQFRVAQQFRLIIDDPNAAVSL